jgi:hypothetical protein
MVGLLDFAARFGTEERCIEYLAGLRWPGGFVCAGCGGRQAWRLKAHLVGELATAIWRKRRPRLAENAAHHRALRHASDPHQRTAEAPKRR